MSTRRQKIIAHLSIAATVSAGLLAITLQTALIGGYVMLAERSIEMELIQINNIDLSPSVNLISAPDTLDRT